MLSYFHTRIKDIYENSFPLIRISRRAFKDKNWITKGLKVSSKRKDKLYSKWMQSNNPSDELLYKSYKKIYEKISNKAETHYYNTLFDSKVNSIKQIWSNLNRVCSASRKNKKSCIVIN